VLIVAASLGAEIASLRREVEQTRLVDGSEQGPGQQSGNRQAVEFHLLGVGPERAGASMTQILAQRSNNTGNYQNNPSRGPNSRVDGVLLLGIAGAAAPDLETGSLLLASQYASDATGQAELLKPDDQMLRQAEQAAARLAMPANRGGSVTVDHLVRETRERRLLREQHGADSINMEDYAAAAAAARVNVPFLAVRVVLDTATQRLPAYLEGISNSRYGIFTRVLAMPWRIPTMWRLKEQLMLCQAVISRIGVTYLALENERLRMTEAQFAGSAPY
jgi:hypothetical protein